MEKPEHWDDQVQAFFIRSQATPDGPMNKAWYDTPLTRVRGLSRLYNRAKSEKLRNYLAGIASERGLKPFPLPPSPIRCEEELELVGAE